MSISGKHISFKKISLFVFVFALIVISGKVAGDYYGPSAKYTNAPGDYGNCTTCHSTYPLQTSGAGYNSISLTQSAPYTSPYAFTLSVNVPGHTRIGFELCVLPTGATSSTPSLGTLSIPAVSSGLIQIKTSAGPSRQYLEHQSTGTSTGTGAKSWTFTWTPPTPGYYGNTNFYVCINSTNSDNNLTGDTIYAKVITFNVLPVKWYSLDASVTNDDVILNWSTASEINNSHFEVERSMDNLAWIIAGNIKGKGTTNSLSTYQFTDERLACSNIAPLYYRVKQVDLDGRCDYSKTVVVNLNPAKNSYIIFPLPSKDVLHITGDQTSGTEKIITVTDLRGNTILEKLFEQSNSKIDLDISSLRKGIYFVQIRGGGKKEIQKILVTD